MDSNDSQGLGPNNPQPDRSGGVDANAERMKVSGDVAGRDIIKPQAPASTNGKVSILVALIAAMAVMGAAILTYKASQDSVQLQINATETAEARLITFVTTQIATSAPTPANSPAPSATPAPCLSYQAQDDESTIKRLIRAEEEAALNKDISIIKSIFAENAVFWDAVSDERWNDPVARYSELFSKTTFKEATHFDIQVANLGIKSNVAYFTSGSQGKFTEVGTPSTVREYSNPSGSDHWTFRKNQFGCWVVTDFAFNASHIPFPP